MLKRIVAVLAGLIVAMLIISLLEMGCGKMFPQPSDADFNNAKVLKQITNHMPVGEFLWLLTGYILGSFAGGVVATLVSGRESFGPAVITGGVVMIGGIMDLMGLPHPLWFSIVSLMIYIPCAYVGYLLVRRKVVIKSTQG